MNCKSYLKIILFLSCIIFSLNSSAQNNREELERQRKEIQAEIETIRTLLSQTQSEEKNLLRELNETNIQINAQTKLIAAFNAESRALSNEISSNQKEIKSLTNDLKKLKEDYAEMIYNSYKSKSQNSRIMFVLSSDNFHQAYKRLQYMKQYTDFRKTQGEQITKKAYELEVLNDTLKVRKKDKDELIDEQKKEQEKLEEEKKNQEVIVSEIKKKERKYGNEIKKKQKEERKIDKQIEKIIRDAIAKSNEGSTTKSSGFALTPEGKLVAAQFEGNKGNLPWPVEEGFVSRRFGKQKHPTLAGIIIESNGVRITTGKGARVRAIFEGTVLRIQSINGRKAVFIQHGNYITLYSNLETVVVKTGDKISTKQNIGKVFTDKISNKTILKFQVWKNTQRLNPASWIYNM